MTYSSASTVPGRRVCQKHVLTAPCPVSGRHVLCQSCRRWRSVTASPESTVHRILDFKCNVYPHPTLEEIPMDRISTHVFVDRFYIWLRLWVSARSHNRKAVGCLHGRKAVRECLWCLSAWTGGGVESGLD